MSAASQAKRIAGDAAEIVAFERGDYSSYSACGIPCWVAGDVGEPKRLIVEMAEALVRHGAAVNVVDQDRAADDHARPGYGRGGAPDHGGHRHRRAH